MQHFLLSMLKPGITQTRHRQVRREGDPSVRSNFSAARQSLEDAYRLLSEDDELSLRLWQAIAILIDAFLAAEYSRGKDDAKVIDFESYRSVAGR
jgi:hypothetical protein